MEISRKFPEGHSKIETWNPGGFNVRSIYPQHGGYNSFSKSPMWKRNHKKSDLLVVDAWLNLLYELDIGRLALNQSKYVLKM